MDQTLPYNAAFRWECQPKAEAFIVNIIEEAKKANKEIAILANDLEKHTSTRLFDWIDHISLGHSSSIENELEQCGFVSDHATPTYRIFHHPGAQLPQVVLHDQDELAVGISLIVDRIADFLMARGMSGMIEGSPFSPCRRCRVSTEGLISLWIYERRGVRTIEPVYTDEGYLERYFEAREQWLSRPRSSGDEERCLLETIEMAQRIVESIGQDLAAYLILECERDYWQARNGAGQIQKNRQDRLGMGWANHDHHTFRSSRIHFTKLVRLFEILGFHCRERFYAGEEAGWGAQVMENPRCRLILFLDVDLAPSELEIDFSHHPLFELDRLGTIGLWCALHGDSILKAGMHHLEAQFQFEQLTHDLAIHGISMMDPFSNMPYLKQAFTHGEIWPVDSNRIDALLWNKKITREQADKFRSYGAVGSHLENLQRREGYKGFNQKNVSFIIKKTDPRH